MAYLLDSNVFIEAKKRWYGLDFCPAYWEWLDRSHSSGLVFSVERVQTEIAAHDDDLLAWVNARAHGFFLTPDQAVLNSLSELTTWATGGQYNQAAVTTFLDGADSYLVAHAHAHGYVVVTHEIVGSRASNVKIPNACVAMNVRYLNTFEMLRTEQARFVL